MYQVVMTDLDGTLLNSDHEISYENQKALEALKEKGVSVVFASGRMYKAIKRITKAVAPCGIIVACNGGYIVDEKHQKVISESHFHYESSLAIIDVLESMALSHHFYTGDTVYAMHHGNSTLFSSMQGFLDELKIRLIAHSPLGQYIHQGVKPHKFGVLLDEGTDVEALVLKLSAIPGIDCFKSAAKLLDIMPKGVNKGFALDCVADYLGLSAEDFVACGDQENDIEMIQKAGMGISASGSIVALQKVADRQLDETSPHIMAYINDTFF